MSKLPVAILGATGTVGQKFVGLLANHPWFEIAAVTASPQNAGKRYSDAVRWREPAAIPDEVAGLTLGASDSPADVAFAFSALDARAAGPIEPAWARAGAAVVTNASPHRMDPLVPLVVPEVNHDHLALLDQQRAKNGWSGAIVANPNCTTAGLVLALAPLHRAFGIERFFLSTMQAVSGAGWPGVASLDILGNVIPFIEAEEEKVERETRKLFADERVLASVHTNRVPVDDGHTETISLGCTTRVTPDEALEVFRTWQPDPLVAALPSTPAEPLAVDQRPDRPQPRLDRDRGGGMTVTIGRLRSCPILDLRFVILSHNTVRGAAGASVQNAELLVATGRVAR